MYIYYMPGQSVTAAYHSLFFAVIDRAIADLEGVGPKCRETEKDRAMAFVLGDTCEAYCLELEIDYKTICEKAAGLYRKIMAADNTPRTVQITRRKGRLSGNRSFPVSKIEILKPYSSPQIPPRGTAMRDG